MARYVAAHRHRVGKRTVYAPLEPIKHFPERRAPISDVSLDWLCEVIEKRPEMLKEEMARDLLRRVINELQVKRADVEKCKRKLREVLHRLDCVIETGWPRENEDAVGQQALEVHPGLHASAPQAEESTRRLSLTDAPGSEPR